MYLEKLNEREVWYKLVVKIICWKEIIIGNSLVKNLQKITALEWDTYSKRIIKINVTHSKQRVLSELQETKDLIEKSGGFE